jgi:photosystem II stability/assembly factor-like uncharacterized protein
MPTPRFALFTLYCVACACDPAPDGTFDASPARDAGRTHTDADVRPVTDAGVASGDATITTIDAHVPIVVTDCDGLPAVGEWVDISPPELRTPINMEVTAIIVDPRTQAIFTGSSNNTNGGPPTSSGILRSDDCGATWERVSTAGDSSFLLTGIPWSMAIDPSDPDVMYVANGYGQQPTIYRSDDAGTTWRALSPHPDWGVDSFVQAIALDPTNPAHVAVSFHANCDPPHHANCLSRSTDRGETWELIDGPREIAGWTEAASVTILGGTSYLYSGDAGAFYTENAGADWHRVVDRGLLGSYNGSALVLGDRVYVGGNGSRLFSAPLDPARLAASWSEVSGSPSSGCTSMVVGDGYVYCTSVWDYGGQPFWRATVSDLETWTRLESPTIARGGYALAYDESHHILYAAGMTGGLWRVVLGP